MRVYLDTAAVIYLVENIASWEPAVQAFLRPPEVVPQASVLTRMERRVQPWRDGRSEVLADYDQFFASLDGGLLELGAAEFEKATERRARLTLRTPDALHLAVAICRGCDVFLTNDHALARCAEIHVQVLAETR